jgi:hypothetical protein
MGVRYATREAVKAALDVRETARTDALVDDALDAATIAVDGLLRRTFRPLKATKSYDWPNNGQYARTWTLWLDAQPDWLITLASATSGGTVLNPGNLILGPTQLGPPFNNVEINLGSGSAWNSGSATWQQSIALNGTWGYQLDYASAGAAAEAIDESETGIDVTDSAAIGVGDFLLVDAEWMNVTGKQSLSTGQTISADLAASLTADAVGTNGGAFHIGELLTVDTERMLVVDILGSTLAVKRGYDGSTLATHTTGATIYAQRTLVVERGARGSEAGTHSNGATIRRHDVPAIVRSLAIAEAQNTILSRRSGYARTVGSGDAEQEASGRGLARLRTDAVNAIGRTLRKAAI